MSLGTKAIFSERSRRFPDHAQPNRTPKFSERSKNLNGGIVSKLMRKRNVGLIINEPAVNRFGSTCHYHHKDYYF